MNIYPRETVEFLPVTVTVDGVNVTTGVEFAITAGRNRPVTWAAATTLSGRIGVMLTGLTVGPWHVWARITANPEVPVIDCGAFQVD